VSIRLLYLIFVRVCGWFLAEGLLWGILGLVGLGPSPARRWWTGTALAAIAVVTSTGLLSAFNLIGKTIIF
jgi:hypothetical protein